MSYSDIIIKVIQFAKFTYNIKQNFDQVNI